MYPLGVLQTIVNSPIVSCAHGIDLNKEEDNKKDVIDRTKEISLKITHYVKEVKSPLGGKIDIIV